MDLTYDTLVRLCQYVAAHDEAFGDFLYVHVNRPDARSLTVEGVISAEAVETFLKNSQTPP